VEVKGKNFKKPVDSGREFPGIITRSADRKREAL